MFKKKKEPVVPIEIGIPKVDSIQYVKVKMKMSDGTKQDGYRLVCPCGNYNRDKYGTYIKTVLEEDERGRMHSTKVMSLLCNKCKCYDIPYVEFQKEYEKIVKPAIKEKIKA